MLDYDPVHVYIYTVYLSIAAILAISASGEPSTYIIDRLVISVKTGLTSQVSPFIVQTSMPSLLFRYVCLVFHSTDIMQMFPDFTFNTPDQEYWSEGKLQCKSLPTMSGF